MTTAERSTLHALTAELVTAELYLSSVQDMLNPALNARNKAQEKLDRFISAIPVSDAPAPATRKRRSDYGTTGVRKLGLPSAEQPTVEAVRERLQPSLSGLPDEDIR